MESPKDQELALPSVESADEFGINDRPEPSSSSSSSSSTTRTKSADLGYEKSESLLAGAGKTQVRRRFCGLDAVYLMSVCFVCVIVLTPTLLFLAFFAEYCVPCDSYAPDLAVYVRAQGILAAIPSVGRTTADRCAIMNGSIADTIITSGRDWGSPFGYVRLFNGVSSRDLVSIESDSVLEPNSIAIDYCTSDIYIADTGDGAILRLTCVDDHESFEEELCGDYASTYIAFDQAPLALGSLQFCNSSSPYLLFVVGVSNQS